MFDPNHPVIVGLTGEAGTGKTSTANIIAPVAQNLDASGGDERISCIDGVNIYWSHLFFAMPIYEIVNIKRIIQGADWKDRQLYAIHNVIANLFGENPLYGAPPYKQLVEMTYEVTEKYIPEDGKPREFMQWLGTDYFRAYQDDCFIRSMQRRINKEKGFITNLNSKAEEGERIFDTFGVVISDVRFPNEAEIITSAPNGILIKLNASYETRMDRLDKRDGFVMSTEGGAHASETSIDLIPLESYSAIVETDDMTLEEQAIAVKQAIVNSLRSK